MSQGVGLSLRKQRKEELRGPRILWSVELLLCDTIRRECDSLRCLVPEDVSVSDELYPYLEESYQIKEHI